jgi:hypothetical protein
MTTIYKQLSPVLNIAFSESQEISSFEHWIKVQPELLEYKLINTENTQTIVHVKLALSELRGAERFYSGTLFSFKNSAIKKDGSLVNLTSSDLSSLLQNSLPTKSHHIYTDTINSDCNALPFRIFVPTASSDFTECKYTIGIPGDGAEYHTVTVETNNTASYDDTPTLWKSLFDTITLSTSQSTVNVGDPVVVNVQAENTDLDYVYLEQVCGILDRTKVSLVNGVGSFTVLTNTLSSGDVIEVKYGYKLYTGLGTFTKTIS